MDGKYLVGQLPEECSVCGRAFSPVIEYDNQYKIKSLLMHHEECVNVTKKIVDIKEQIKDLEKKLCDEEFTLFCIRLRKHDN